MAASNPTPGMPVTMPAARLTLLAILTFLYFFLATVAVHVLRPDRNPMYDSLSSYAVGPYGFLLKSGFVAFGLGLLALALGLGRAVSPSNWLQLGVILLGVAGVSTILLGVFPGDVYPTPRTRIGAIHDLVSALAFLCVVAAMLFLSRGFGKTQPWLAIQRPASALAMITLAGLVLFIFDHRPIVQKSLVALILLWLLLTAVRLRAVVSKPTTMQRGPQ